ncbi:MAG: diguanylate cyclase/phosphodiesterase (GGDEF & EAL domains) with PAS/PAC sensor(s) [uncultured Thermomicrobiales bacterium]|uniref:Diguanylate cyclase/phosphodiesterase (GGDEF & EAL domains) with PAS/PAC sensor(S) n=1 Tax=uncultured Thermomicrobiales bacterium TaxID=1645740 RepID=A0A6J4UZ17_9BACT|nr:MAG: diguanylate cyclase/phosphodiesterase (GGDEF & EAL domains) with PAS/PAC sensor(s) [uncultured Thermomicrobiales bacterium]
MLATGIRTDPLHAVAAAPVILFALDRDGTLTFCAGGGLAVAGLRADDLLWRPASALLSDDPDALADCRRALAGEPAEGIVILADRPYHVRYIPSRDAVGGVNGMYGLAVAEGTELRTVDPSWEGEEHFRGAFAHAAIGMALVGLDGRWLRVNRALCALLGYDEAALLATDFQALTHPDDLALDLHQVAALLADTIEDYQMKRYRHRDGRYIWALLSVSLVRDGRGAAQHFVSQIQDIEGRKRAEEALRASEARYRELLAAAERQARELQLLDRVRTALARELDPATAFRVIVEAIATTFGYTQVSLYLREGEEHVLQHQVGYEHVLARVPVAAGVSGRAVREGRAILIGNVADDPSFLGAIDGITSEICVPLYDAGRPAGFLNVESHGDLRLTEADLHLMEALGEQVGIAIERAHLYAALREREERLAHLALHDPLTRLPNRRGLGEALGGALSRQGRGGPMVALLYIDLDGFKGINDALGHEAGDYLLGEVADRLRACVRAGDTPARLGGDEFAILLEGVGEVQAVGGRVLEELATPVRIGVATATVTASVGGAVATAGETADDLLRRADTALYAAKHAGKNRFLLAEAARARGDAATAG